MEEGGELHLKCDEELRHQYRLSFEDQWREKPGDY